MQQQIKRLVRDVYVLAGDAARLIDTGIARARLRLYGARIGKELSVRGWIKLHISPNSQVIIGDNITIKSGFAENAVGGSLRMGIWVNRGGKLTIENGAGLSNSTIVCSQTITIGERTFIGGGTAIYDTNFHSLDPVIRVSGRDDNVKTAPVNIGKECFIGGHCIILKGVTIGDQAVIGAGSVVTKDIPARQIWAGNPARFIKNL